MISWVSKEIQVTKEELGLDATLIKEKNPRQVEDKMRIKHIAFNKEEMSYMDGQSKKTQRNEKEVIGIGVISKKII